MDRIYPIELQLNRTSPSDTEAPFLNLNLCISYGTVSTNIMINGIILIWYSQFPFYWMPMSPGVPHMGLTYLSLLDSPELLRILVTLAAVIKPWLPNFLDRAIVLFLNFLRRFRNFIADSALVETYSVILKTLLQQDISEPEFYGD